MWPSVAVTYAGIVTYWAGISFSPAGMIGEEWVLLTSIEFEVKCIFHIQLEAWDNEQMNF